jgi:hypothetical protein
MGHLADAYLAGPPPDGPVLGIEDQVAAVPQQLHLPKTFQSAAHHKRVLASGRKDSFRRSEAVRTVRFRLRGSNGGPLKDGSSKRRLTHCRRFTAIVDGAGLPLKSRRNSAKGEQSRMFMSVKSFGRRQAYESPRGRTRGPRAMAMGISDFGRCQRWRDRCREAPGWMWTDRFVAPPRGVVDLARGWTRLCRR